MSVTVTVDASGAVDRFGRARVNLHELARVLPQEAALAALPAYREAAPKRTGKLARETHVDGHEVISDARSSKGYSYTGVTRFGHRRTPDDLIHAKMGGALGPMPVGGGRFGWRHSVKRYHPAFDWADRGFRRARPVVNARFAELVKDAVR